MTSTSTAATRKGISSRSTAPPPTPGRTRRSWSNATPCPPAPTWRSVENYIADGPWTLTIEQFEGQPDQVVPGREAWTLTCEGTDGHVYETHQVFVDRGQRVTLNMACGQTVPEPEQCFTGGKNPKPRKCPVTPPRP